MIKAVLFDIGDVLFNEDVPHTWLFHSCFLTLRKHGKQITWDVYNAERIRLASEGPNPEDAIQKSVLVHAADSSEGETMWKEARAEYDRMRHVRPYGFLLDGMTTALLDLRPDFKLGVVANQHPPVADALAEYGVAELFQTIVISETVGLFKPDPAIFQLGLDNLGITPEEAIFVGDRPDNDVMPAKALGMRTIRFKRGNQYVYFNPETPEMTADLTITDIAQLPGTVRQLAAESSR
jgi:HAD superfamily hydrolase (TIGR01509 family)